MRRRYLLLLLALYTAGNVAAVHAANLINNSPFDSSADGWQIDGGAGQSVAWTAGIDGKDSISSGVLAFSSTAPADAYGPKAYQCVPVTGGAAYELGARIWEPAGQTASGHAFAKIYFSAGSNCDGGILGNPSLDGPGPEGRFLPVALRNIIAPATAHSARIVIGMDRLTPGGAYRVYFDDVFFGDAGSLCIPDDSTLCLNANRFSVTATYQTPDAAQASPAHMRQLTSDSGYMWFFNEENIEAIVKVLNACGVNVRYWNFAGGLTNVRVVTTVRDMKTGATKIYTNAQGTPFQPLQDTAAFATCP